MKQFLLLGLGCLLAASAAAQTQKGARFIGANIGELSYRKAKSGYGGSSFTVALYPSAGVFVANNFLVGANIPLGYQRVKLGDLAGDYSTTVLQYGLIPFVRYYIPSTSSHRFFGHLGGGVTWQTVRQPVYGGPNTDSYTRSYGTLGAALGYNYFLTPGAALEVTAGYTRNDNGIGQVTGSTGLLDIRAGFSIFLPSKQAASAPAE